MLRFAKDLCALLLAAAILLGPAAALAGPADCDCKAQCSMHAQKLGCHESHETHAKLATPSMPCHGKAGVTLKSAGCGHASGSTASAPSWRGIMPRLLALSIAFTPGDVPEVCLSEPTAPSPEPPPHPPKSLSVVA